MSDHTMFMKKMKYINEMMGCACFPDLLSMKIFPDGKEITESCSPYNFLRNNKESLFSLGDSNVALISVGDGCAPRTAAMFAFRTAWNCYSIDPNMNWKNNGRVDRLECFKCRVEEMPYYHFDNLVLLHIHSHAPLLESCNHFTANKRIVLSMPCCVKQVREREPDLIYVDESVWSPHNKNLVWYDL